MSYFPLTDGQQAWKQRAAEIAERELAPRAASVDETGRFPQDSLQALRQAGLWSLRVSSEHGGSNADLLSTVLVVEELAKKCPSTAMCYKMHLEATEVLCRRATEDQVERFIKPLVEGELFATVAGSETWTDGNNWSSSRRFAPVQKVDGGYMIKNVRKSYVTSAGHASHYFFLCRVGEDTPLPDITLLMVERKEVEAEILEPWDGLGLRGNESCPVRFDGFVPEANRIGAEHSGMRDATGVFMPVLGLTYAAAYLGIGSGALELAIAEGNHAFADGSRRFESPINQRRVAELSTRVEAAQTLLHAAADTFDRGALKSSLPILQAKVTCSETAVYVTQELMTMFGGTAFAGRLPFERYFRDARASMIMALPNDVAYADMFAMIVPQAASGSTA